KYKRVVNDGPLSDEGKATIQDQVDHIYSVFVDAVARNRGTDSATVLKNMADGRTFMGRKAIAAGLVDGVSTLNDAIQQLQSQQSATSFPVRTDASAATATRTEVPKEKK